MSKILEHGAALVPLFMRGTVLWRPVLARGDAATKEFNFEVNPADEAFVETDKGSYICRISLPPSGFIFEPEVTTSNSTHGIIVFADSCPPTNWTHLVVTGVSRALKEGSESGAAIFARVPTPYDMDEYLVFRSDLANCLLKQQEKDVEFDELGRISKNFWPCDLRPEEIRCMITSNYDAETNQEYYEYCQFRRKPLSVAENDGKPVIVEM